MCRFPAPPRLRRDGDGSFDSSPRLRPGVCEQDRRFHEGGGHPLPARHGSHGAASPAERADPGEVPGKRVRERRRARRGGVRHGGELHRPLRGHGATGPGQPGREDASREDPVGAGADERGEHLRHRGRALRKAGAHAGGDPGGEAAGAASVRREQRADGLRERADDGVHAAGVRKLRADRGGGERAVRGGQRGGVREPIHAVGVADLAASAEGRVFCEADNEARRRSDPGVPRAVAQCRGNHAGIRTGLPDQGDLPESDGSGGNPPHHRRGVHHAECHQAVGSLREEGRMLRLSLRCWEARNEGGF